MLGNSSKNRNNEELTSWLEQLQQNSWNLELIISGFSLFLLFQAQKGITYLEGYISMYSNYAPEIDFFLSFVPSFLTICISLFKINLVVHVFLRGLWIGTIGLRYVSQGIEIKQLGYAKKFHDFLDEELTGKYDDYIDGLERISSLIFAYTYLLVYYVFSLFAWVIFIALIVFFIPLLLVQGTVDPENLKFLIENKVGSFLIWSLYSGLIFTIFFCVSLLIFLDFITCGYLKKIKWLSHIYYPCYRFFGFITFSKWIRPILYNFLDDKLGKKFIYVAPIYIIAFFVLNVFVGESFLMKKSFFPEMGNKETQTDYQWMKQKYYMSDVDMNSAESVMNKSWSSTRIGSDLIENNILPIFYKYDPSQRRYLEFCDSVKMYQEIPNMPEIAFQSKYELNYNYIIQQINENMVVEIDSTVVKAEFDFYTFPHTNERGIFSYVNLDSIPDGKRRIKVYRKVRNDRRSRKEFKTAGIPFWKKTSK